LSAAVSSPLLITDIISGKKKKNHNHHNQTLIINNNNNNATTLMSSKAYLISAIQALAIFIIMLGCITSPRDLFSSLETTPSYAIGMVSPFFACIALYYCTGSCNSLEEVNVRMGCNLAAVLLGAGLAAAEPLSPSTSSDPTTRNIIISSMMWGRIILGYVIGALRVGLSFFFTVLS
jgi:hypothetical protein